MIKCEVINEDFTLKRFNELKNIKRKAREQDGKLFKGDIFECSKELADYLTGNNPLNKVVVKIVEVKPEKNEVKTEVVLNSKKIIETIKEETLEDPYKDFDAEKPAKKVSKNKKSKK